MYPEATDSTSHPTPGSGERCAECGAAARHDQRYCLECGAPLHEDGAADRAATIDFAQVPPAGSAASPPSSPPPHLLSGGPSGPAPGQHHGSATTVIASVGVLLLAIGVGVLIGRSGSGGSNPPASTPQVITVSAPSTSATSTETTSTSSTSSGSAKGAHGKQGAKPSGSQRVEGGSESHPASPKVIEKLEKPGGGTYEQKSNKLPNVVSTG